MCHLVKLLVFEGIMPHQGDLVPVRVVALRTLVGTSAGEQGGEDVGVVGQEVVTEVPLLCFTSAVGTQILVDAIFIHFDGPC